jgi:hypothetical protein
MPQKELEESVDFNAVALLGAIAFPGLGHVLSGRAKRGILAGIGVLGLFGGGLLTAGLTAVDRQQEFWWFVPQAGVGPLAFGVDWVHQNKFKVALEGGKPGAKRSADPDEGVDPVTRRARPLAAGEKPLKVVALGKPAELGLLMCALGGMMNFIVVVDAGFPTRRPKHPGGVSGQVSAGAGA